MLTPLISPCIICNSNYGDMIKIYCQKCNFNTNYAHLNCLNKITYIKCNNCNTKIEIGIKNQSNVNLFYKIIWIIFVLITSFLLSYLVKMIIYTFIISSRVFLINNKYLYYNQNIYNDPLVFIVHELIGIMFFILLYYPCSKCLNRY